MWRGNSISLEGESLQDVLDDLQRREIDVHITLSFKNKRGSCWRTIKTFRLVGLCNEEIEEYQFYLTNRRHGSPAPVFTSGRTTFTSHPVVPDAGVGLRVT
jgi:hypothetical protein